MMRRVIQTLQRRARREERGAVMVLVAAGLPALVILGAFVIDVGHWYDYSRNLQNRADAAALAAGVQYGNTCFNNSWKATPPNPTNAIGTTAQQYSGPPNGTPNPNLPFGFALPAANQPYQNQPNLSKGTPGNFHLLLNSNANWGDPGAANWSMGADGFNTDSRALCDSADGADKGAMTDVRVTQANLGLFFAPLFSITPTISAHARVEVQGIQSEVGLRPIAVGDAAYTPCAKANFLDNDGALIATEKLTRIGTSDTWSSIGDAKPIHIPGAPSRDPVTVQISINNCSTTNYQETLYDYTDNKGKDNPFGLVYINNYGTPGAVGANGSPTIAAGGVHLTGATGTTCDPYFLSSTTACQIGVHANIQFQPAQPGVTRFFARALIDGKTATAIDLTQNTPGPTDWDSVASAFTVQPDSGSHTITIQWAQLGGSTAAGSCKPLTFNGDKYGNANNCTGTLTNAVQRTFAGTNGTNACNNPNFDTGPMQWIDVGTTDGAGATSGANAYAQGDNPHLYITTSIQGLSNSQPSDPDICLRVAVQTQHGTGFVDCGQGNGGGGPNGDIATIVNGCPVPPGVQKNVRVQADGSLICTPTITPWDCVGNDPGNSPPVLKGFDQLIGDSASGCAPNNPCSAPNNCPANNWGGPNAITLADPRAVPMIITAPIDLQDQNGAAGQQIPIRNFAVFYVTGWSSKAAGFNQGGVTGCKNNDPAPTGAVDGELWGHWTSLAVPSGSGSGNGGQCDPSQFGNCIAVLTR
jgi:hypothetical protein